MSDKVTRRAIDRDGQSLAVGDVVALEKSGYRLRIKITGIQIPARSKTDPAFISGFDTQSVSRAPHSARLAPSGDDGSYVFADLQLLERAK